MFSLDLLGHRNVSNRNSVELKKYCDAIQNFISQQQGQSVLVYTDGSVFNGPAGCGACAAVLNPLSAEDGIQCTSKAVGMKVSSVTCEIEGIILGMVVVLQYFRLCSSRKFVEYLYILCDSSVAIDLAVQRYHHSFGYELFHSIRSMEKELLEISVEIHLMWIPAHIGIELHNKADRLARLEARNIHLEISPAPAFITFDNALNLSKDIAMKSWQQKWQREVTGQLTRQFIPQVGTKILFPDCRQIGISYCRMLLNDTMLNDDSYRTGTSDTPVCECASKRETVEHFLVRCPRYKQFRSDLISTVQEIGTSSKSKSHLYLSPNLLIAPCWDANLSKNEDKAIKDALFHYLASVQRNL